MLARLRRWIRAAIVASAIAYPITLLLVVAVFWFVGEDWWVTGFALYLPRLLFGVPLPLLVVALALLRRRRLLLLQLVSAALWLFPLMGLCISWPASVPATAAKVRVLHYNVNSCNGGVANVTAEILAHRPQIAFVQELPSWKSAELEAALTPHFAHVRATSEFLVASSFPLVSVEEAPELSYLGRTLPARVAKFVIATAAGEVAFISVHPISPRSDFQRTRGGGLRKEIITGRLFERAVLADMQRTSRLREMQVQVAVDWAAAERRPAVLIGDINLPQLSPTRHRLLGSFQDGYAEVGFGFGYTFPSRFPWLRLDVILASEKLVFTAFEVGHSLASDHRAVVAELAVSTP